MLGFFQEFQPKFVKQYLDGSEIVKKAVDEYVKDVQARNFPTKEHTY
jgi:3-methyl-2-oxobutanoate hydroxymethyltransferase